MSRATITPIQAMHARATTAISIQDDDADGSIAPAILPYMPRTARYADGWWQYDAARGCYAELTTEAFTRCVRQLLRRVEVGGKPITVRSSLVEEILASLKAHVEVVPDDAPLPHPFARYAGPDPRKVAIVANGILDLSTRSLHPLTDDLFAVSASVATYAPGARCPRWLRFLVETFQGEKGQIDLLRQIIGWIVSTDTSRHAIPLLIGFPRSGKGTIQRVLASLLDRANGRNVCSPSLARLAKEGFALAPLMSARLAMISDLRLGRHTDQAAVVSVLLRISGGDQVSVDRKHRDERQITLGTRLFVVSNEAPMLHDDGGALAGRWRALHTRADFEGHEDLQLGAKLAAELSGILNWALDGYDDLQRRGWVKPRTTEDLRDMLERTGSAVKAFVRDRCVLAAGKQISAEDLMTGWRAWCWSVGRREPGTEMQLGRALNAVCGNRVRARRASDKDEAGKRSRPTVYEGIDLIERIPAVGATPGVEPNFDDKPEVTK